MGLFAQKPHSNKLSQDLLSQVSVMGELKQKNSPVQAGAKTPPQAQKPSSPENPFFSGAQIPAPPKEAGMPVAWTSQEKAASPLPREPFQSVLKKIAGFRSRSLWLALGLFGITLLALGGYFLYQKREVPEPLPPVPLEEPAPLLETAIFSLEKANYLSLNTETATLESVQGEIAEQSQKLLESNINQPVPFLITDQNNNPLAFSRFVFLLDISLPNEFLAALEEEFTLYLVRDREEVRMGLRVDFKPDYANPEELIQSVEPTLLSSMRTLFYPVLALPAKPVFATGVYAGTPVRYVNIDGVSNFSLDYILSNKTLIMGNSKEGTRAIFSAQQSLPLRE